MTRSTVLMLAFCPSIAYAAAGSFDPLARLPVIYVIDYGLPTRDWDAVIQTYTKAPPDILHTSKLGTYSFRGGPTIALGTQDMRDPELKLRRLLSPQDAAKRSARLKEFVKRIYAAGVGCLAPYTCLGTIAGDHEKRLGFWEFYDRWDDYRKIGLYQRPKTDPFTWNQQWPDGRPRWFYPHDFAPFKPLYRYAASPAHPDWERWIQFCVQDFASLGMGGVFVDNAGMCRDFGPFAKRAFDRWIRRRYSAAQRNELFGGMPRMTEELGSLAAFETHLCWLDLIRQHLSRVRAAAEAIRKPFIVIPNGGEQRESRIEFAFADADFVMFERGRASVPGRGSAAVIGPFRRVRYRDNLFAYAYTFGVGARVRALTLTWPGRPAELYGYNRNVALLTHAEAAAFSGGGAATSPGPLSYPEFNDVQNLYRRHYRQHRSLYEHKRTLPVAAVACFGSQAYYGHQSHISTAKAVYDALLEHHILTDVLTAPGCFGANLARYQLIVLPDVRYLSDEQLAAFVEFQRNGGELLVYGHTGDYDQYMRKREHNPLARSAVEDGFGYESLAAKLAKCKHKVWPALVPAGLEHKWEDWAVKASAYVDDPAQPRQLVLHIVNYNVDLGRGVDRVVRVPSVAVRLPLPPKMKPRRVQVIRVDDDKEERVLPSVKGDAVSFRVLDVGVHTICVVE